MEDHIRHVNELVQPRPGDLAVDVGCGDGLSTRALAKAGWRALGLEITPSLVERARRSAPDVARVEFAQGRGEALPPAAAGAALIVYLFSFHHVPEHSRSEALDCARMRLKTGGRLHIADPLPGGPMSEVVLPVEDEGATRSHAHRLLGRLDGNGWRLLSRNHYVHGRIVPGYQTIEDDLLRADPSAAQKIKAARPEMELRFRRFGVVTEGGIRLDQPCVAYHFEKE